MRRVVEEPRRVERTRLVLERELEGTDVDDAADGLERVGTEQVAVHFQVAANGGEVPIGKGLGRRGEIGCHLDAVGLLFGHGMRLTLIGIAIGIPAAVGATRFLSALLFGVNPIDVPTLVIVSAVISVIAVIACLVPAWRATRVDPLIVIRET